MIRLVTVLLTAAALIAAPAVSKAETVTKKRLEVFFKKHKVKRPTFYAGLITDRIKSHQHRKVMAAILVPETRGRANLVSKEGAVGPWQLHPYWFKRYGRAADPASNLKACYAVFLLHLEEEGNLRGALRSYSGRSARYPNKVQLLMREI